jgi:hypothetical protein
MLRQVHNDHAKLSGPAGIVPGQLDSGRHKVLLVVEASLKTGPSSQVQADDVTTAGTLSRKTLERSR